MAVLSVLEMAMLLGLVPCTESAELNSHACRFVLDSKCRNLEARIRLLDESSHYENATEERNVRRDVAIGEQAGR